jgi:hypothetical protein
LWGQTPIKGSDLYTGFMRPTKWLAGLGAIVIVAVLAAQERSGSPRPEVMPAESGPALRPAQVEIQGEQIAAHLQFLADDRLEGRAPSTSGGELAARYLATQLALLGYEPAGESGTFFQPVPIVESVVDGSFTLTAGAGPPIRYLDDVVAFTGVQAPQVVTRGEVVFVGHGIVAPEFTWNDYAGVDMKGRIAFHEEYRARRYHQPSDEMQPSWDYAGAVNDMRFLAELGWRIANAPDMAAYHPGEQFARPRLNSTN